MQRICMVEGSICGLFSSGDMVGSSYISMSASICMIIWIFEKGPMKGVKFWYQLLSGIVSMVMVWGSFFATNLAQYIAIWALTSLCGWVHPTPLHLYENAFPMDPKSLFLENGE